MFEAYSVGVSLKLMDLVSAPLLKISGQLKEMDVLVASLNKNLKAVGAESAGMKSLSSSAGTLDKHLAAANLQTERLERNMAALRAMNIALPAPGGAVPVPGGRIPGAPSFGGSHGVGGGFGHAGSYHGGMHFGPGGLGMSAASLSLGDAFVPIAAVGAASYVGKQFYDAAKDFDLEFNKFKALGLSNAQNQEARAFVKNMKTFGVSMTENMTLFRDAQTVFRDSGTLEHAQIVAPVLAKMKLANTYLGGEAYAGDMEHKFMDFLRVIELRKGLSSTEEFITQANMVQQVLTTSGGRVDPSQLLAFMKTGGTAAYGLSNQAMYYQLEPLLQEFGGQRLGTALQTSYNRLQLGIGVSHTAANEMLRLGLLDKNKIELNHLGGFKRYKTGENALVGADLMRQSPVDFFEKIILPMYAKQGITKEEDILRENALIFGRTGGAMYNSIYRQLGNIRKGESMAEHAMTIDQAIGLAKGSPQGAEQEFLAAWKDFKTEAGQSLLPEVTEFLKGGAMFFRGIGEVGHQLRSWSEMAGGFFEILSKLSPSGLMHGGPLMELAKGMQYGGGHPVQVTTQINMDGRKVAEAVTKHQTKEATRPMGGASFHDGLMAPTLAPMPY